MSYTEMLMWVIGLTLFSYYRATCLGLSMGYGRKVDEYARLMAASDEISDRTLEYARWQFKTWLSIFTPFLLPFAAAAWIVVKFARVLRGEPAIREQEGYDFSHPLYRQFYSGLSVMAFIKRPALWSLSLAVSAVVVCVITAFALCLIMLLSAVCKAIRLKQSVNFTGRAFEAVTQMVLMAGTGKPV